MNILLPWCGSSLYLSNEVFCDHLHHFCVTRPATSIPSCASPSLMQRRSTSAAPPSAACHLQEVLWRAKQRLVLMGREKWRKALIHLLLIGVNKTEI